MKKLLVIAALLSVALSSCVTNEEWNDEVNSEIKFTAVNKVPTKAIVETATFADSDTFQVWGFYGTEAFALYNKTISKVDTNNDSTLDTWKVDGETYYWPLQGSVTFYGLYPATVEPTSVDATNGIKLTNYTVTGKEEQDIMYAKNTGSKGSSPLAMVFNHALAQVEVTIKTNSNYAPAEFYVNSISLKNVNVTADFTQNGTSLWTNNTDQNATEAYHTEEVAAPTEAVAYGTGVVVIPQTLKLESNSALSINYTLKQGSSEISGTVEPAISGEWKAGSKYIYELTFNLDEITFNPSYTNWVTVDTITISAN